MKHMSSDVRGTGRGKCELCVAQHLGDLRRLAHKGRNLPERCEHGQIIRVRILRFDFASSIENRACNLVRNADFEGKTKQPESRKPSALPIRADQYDVAELQPVSIERIPVALRNGLGIAGQLGERAELDDMLSPDELSRRLPALAADVMNGDAQVLDGSVLRRPHVHRHTHTRQTEPSHLCNDHSELPQDRVEDARVHCHDNPPGCGRAGGHVAVVQAGGEGPELWRVGELKWAIVHDEDVAEAHMVGELLLEAERRAQFPVLVREACRVLLGLLLDTKVCDLRLPCTQVQPPHMLVVRRRRRPDRLQTFMQASTQKCLVIAIIETDWLDTRKEAE